jgi:hypothetical protein
MPDVTYTGTADERSLSAEDWERLGVKHDDVTWQSGEAVKVSAAAAKALREQLPGEFAFGDEDKGGDE